MEEKNLIDIEWRGIDDFPNYEVSNTGLVRNIVTNNILKQNKRPAGNLAVNLYNNGIRKTFSVHRLVAAAFLPDWDPDLDVNHIDYDISNNHVSNLQMLERPTTSARTRRIRSVDQYTLDGKYVKTFKSYAEASNAVKDKYPLARPSNIGECAEGRMKTVYGYQWKHTENEKEMKKTNGRTKKVNQYDKEGNFITTYDSLAEAAVATGALASNISRVCNGGGKTAKGFIWKFEIEE